MISTKAQASRRMTASNALRSEWRMGFEGPVFGFWRDDSIQHINVRMTDIRKIGAENLQFSFMSTKNFKGQVFGNSNKFDVQKGKKFCNVNNYWVIWKELALMPNIQMFSFFLLKASKTLKNEYFDVYQLYFYFFKHLLSISNY